MADRRRRRKPLADGGSDDSSEDSADEVINNTLSDLGSDAEGANSEYESADEEDLLPPPAVDPNNPDAKLDDDEDRKNPQYIPKKGTFYEHDDRTMPPDEEGNMLRSDLEENTASTSYPGSSLPVVAISDKARADAVDASTEAPARLKKSWRGDEGKWSHDKFQEVEQAPKPREELVSVYGYDIRSEEGAPRARRRRRYGRGPNKYTRNWEDLDAYSRPARGGPSRGGRGGKQGPPHPDHKDLDFPALEEGGETGSKPAPQLNDSNHQENLNQVAAAADQQEQQPSSSQQPPLHTAHTYTNQEYRRSRPADEHGVEERGGRGRGRGGRGGRGRGRGGRTERGGWKGKYADDGFAHHESPRGSDDVRMSGGRSDGSLIQQQGQQQHHLQQHQHLQQQQQHDKHQPLSPRSAPHRKSSETSSHESSRHGGRGDQAHAPHPGSRQQYGGAPQQHPSGYAHQQQQQFARGNQKRYSNQRGSRPGPGGSNMAGGERGVGSGGTGGSGSNPHYTPHPHHNYYYHDNSTTPPPPGPTDRHGPGLVVSSGSSGASVLYDTASGSTAAAHHVPPATVAIPGASSQFVAPPPPSFVQGPSGCIAGGGAIVAATVAAPTPVIPRMFTPVSVVGATSAELVSPELDHAAIAAALIAGAPVVTADPQPAVVARAPFIASDPSRMPCQFSAAPQAAAQQFPAPPAPQFPPYQSYPPPPPPASEGTQPQEVYRNGVMYYNTQSQQPQRSITTLQKRPKAAIPIVPPPEQLPGEKKEGSTPTPDDANRYQTTDDSNATEESLSYDVSANESSEAREERQRTTVVAVERRDSLSGANAVPDFAYEGSAEADPEVVAEVDPSDHYAIQQLQLQQQLQVEEDSDQTSEKLNESQQVSESSKNLTSSESTTQAVSVANNTDSSKTETIAAPSDLSSHDRILSEETKDFSVEDTTEIDGSKFEDSVEQLESSSSVPSSKLSDSVACEKGTESEEKEASIS